MRIAIISDVHGNAFALESVWKDIQNQSPDLIVNLGDQVYGRANPQKAYALQQEIGAVEVQGNTDPWITSHQPLLKWIREQLPEEAVSHLTTLPLTTSVLDGEVLLCHGDLKSHSGHLLWSWQKGPYRANGFRELREHLAGVSARVVLCGHTHREGLTRLDDHLIVNAGAVSHQVDGDPRARWTLLEQHQGRWLTDFRRVVYDWDGAARWVMQHAPSPASEVNTLLHG